MLGGRHSLGTALSSKGQTEDTHIKDNDEGIIQGWPPMLGEGQLRAMRELLLYWCCRLAGESTFSATKHLRFAVCCPDTINYNSAGPGICVWRPTHNSRERGAAAREPCAKWLHFEARLSVCIISARARDARGRSYQRGRLVGPD